jgi:hypothetical protein
MAELMVKGKRGNFLCLFDDDMAEQIFQHTWFAHYDKRMNTHYVQTTFRKAGIQRTLSMQRFVMNTPHGFHTDHINHNTLDNRKENLRVVTPAQNCQNRKLNQKNNKSGFFGVSFHKNNKKWIAKVSLMGKAHYLGLYLTPEEARDKVIEFKRKNMPFSIEARGEMNDWFGRFD